MNKQKNNSTSQVHFHHNETHRHHAVEILSLMDEEEKEREIFVKSQQFIHKYGNKITNASS